MASVDIKKMQRGQIRSGGLRAHFDDARRKTCGHSNVDIDKTKTPFNFWIDAAGYQDVLQKIDERVAAVDAVLPPSRVKKDRITCMSIEIPCPKELSDQGKTREFFDKAYATLGQFLGKENLLGMTVHVDEIHDYMDHGELKTSLKHGHAFAVPYKEGKGINAKSLITPTFLRECTQVIHDMCKEEFGIEYKTGAYARQKEVEELKAESYKELLQEHDRQEDRLAVCKTSADQEYDRWEQLEQANNSLKALSDNLSHQIETKQEYLDKQTESAIKAVYEFLEPLKTQAKEKVKPHKVVIKDIDAYQQIKDLEQSIMGYVKQLQEFSRDLPDKQCEIEDAQNRLEASMSRYEHLNEHLQDEITRKAAQQAQDDYRQYVHDTSRDISRGLDQMLGILHKAGLDATARQVLQENPYLGNFLDVDFGDRTTD